MSKRLPVKHFIPRKTISRTGPVFHTLKKPASSSPSRGDAEKEENSHREQAQPHVHSSPTPCFGFLVHFMHSSEEINVWPFQDLQPNTFFLPVQKSIRHCSHCLFKMRVANHEVFSLSSTKREELTFWNGSAFKNALFQLNC